MTRKDSEKEAERPHYYSQFWLDVAAGRRIIGTPKTNEEGDLEESDAPILSRPVRQSSSSDGYHETIAHPDVEPDFENEDDVYAEPELDDTEPSLDEEEEEIGELEVPPIVVEEEEIPDVDFTPVDAEEEEEEERRRKTTSSMRRRKTKRRTILAGVEHADARSQSLVAKPNCHQSHQ